MSRHLSFLLIKGKKTLHRKNIRVDSGEGNIMYVQARMSSVREAVSVQAQELARKYIKAKIQ